MNTADFNYDRERRYEGHLERVGTRTPKCQECNESNPIALVGEDPNILCYECQAKHAGRSPVEKHHPCGRHNNPITVPIPGNDHRILSDLQQDWPTNTLRNPERSPLLVAAATLRGWLDVLRLLLERVFGWIPPFLEQLDEHLIAAHGEIWWAEFEWNAGTA